MSIKFCVYHGCENYSVNGIIIGDYTIFQFPQDEDKQRQWMNLGKVPPNLPKKSLFMCSEHFDKKYLSINSRRTILIGNAMPYPCNAIVTKEDADKHFITDSNEYSKEERLDNDDDDDDDDFDFSIEEDSEGYFDDDNQPLADFDNTDDIDKAAAAAADAVAANAIKDADDDDEAEHQIFNINFQREFNGRIDDQQDNYDAEPNIKFEVHFSDNDNYDCNDQNHDNFVNADPIESRRSLRNRKSTYKYSSSEKSTSSDRVKTRHDVDNNRKYKNTRYTKSIKTESPDPLPPPKKHASNKRSASPPLKRMRSNNDESKSYYSKKLRKSTEETETSDGITQYVHNNVYWLKMPKDVYTQEKNFFLSKIKKYEMLLNSLKKQIEEVDV